MIHKVFSIAMIIIMGSGFYCTSVLAEDPIGHVTALTGEAFVTHSGGNERTALELSGPVYRGDTIQTSGESKLQIMMEDDSLLNLGERSQLTIKKHLYQPAQNLRDAVYKLVRGKVRVVVGKFFSDPGSRLEVETPTSVAGVRMTEFVVWVVSPELTIVIVLDGEIATKNIRVDLVCREAIVAGYQSQIAKDTCPTAPTETPVERMEEILLETEAYLSPSDREMPFSTASLKGSVAVALSAVPATMFLASASGILDTGMMGVLAGGDVLSALDGTDTQLNVIQPGEVTSPFSLPPVITPIPPEVILPVIVPVILLWPLPPPPQGR
jgi:hypothetical protein